MIIGEFLKITFLFFILILIFNGCINYEQETTLKIDGSGKMKIHYWMHTPDSISLAFIDNLGIFTEDTISSQFSSAYSKVENVIVYSDTTDSTSHAVIELSFNSIDSLNFSKAFSEFNFTFQDGAPGQKVFTQFIPPVATSFGIDANQFSVSYKYNFQGEIITHNATNTDGNSLIWKYTLSEIGKGKTIVVTFRPYKLKETPVWIYYTAGFVLLIVIYFLVRKKKG